MSLRTALRVGLIAGLLLVVAAGFLYVTQRERLLARVAHALETALADQLGTPVDVGRVRLEMVPLAVVAEDVTVRSPSPEFPAPLTVGRITARPSLISLLTQTQVIRLLRIERPRLTLVAGPDGTSNIPPFGGTAPGGPGRPPKVLVRRIEITNAVIAYRSLRGTVTIEGADALLVPDVLMGRVVAEASAPRGTFEVGGRAVPFDAVRIRAEMESGRLTVTSASLDGRGLSATANGRFSFVKPAGLDLTVTASIDLQALGPVVPAARSLSGRLTLEARGTGPFADPTVDGRLDAREVVYDGVPIGTLAGRVTLAHGRLAVADLVADVLDGTLRGSAEIEIGAESPASRVTHDRSLASSVTQDRGLAWLLTLDAAGLRTAALMRRLAPAASIAPPFEASGPVALHGRGWSLRAIEGEGRLTLTPGEAPLSRDARSWPRADQADDGHPPSRVFSSVTQDRGLAALLALITTADLPWTVRSGALRIEEGLVTSATGRLAVSGTLAPDGRVALDLALSDQDAADVATALAVPFAIEGRAGFEGRLTGPLRAPSVDGRATVRDLSLRGRAAGDLATSLHYADRRLAFRGTAWRKDDAHYDPVGTLDWSAPAAPAFDIVANLRAARVGDVLSIAFRPLPIEAVTDGTFTFRGSPTDFQIAGDLELGAGSIYGQSFDGGRMGMTFDRTHVVFTHATLRRGESEVRGRGSIVYRDGFEAAFDAPRLHIQTVDLFGLNTLPLSGSVSATLKASGTFDRPEMHAAVTILHLEGAGQPLGGGRVAVDVADRRVRLSASLDEQHAQLEATLRWEPDFPVSAVLTVDDGSLVPLIRPWLPAALAEMTAVVSGRIALDGPLRAPLRWRVESRLRRLSADVGEYVVENQGDVVLILDQGRLTIDAFRLLGTDTTLTISGGVDLLREYHLVIVGEADLRLTRLLVPTVSSGRGKTYLVLKISDRWDSPKIQGGVTIRDARIKSRALSQPITVDSMGLFFNERQILLESLEGGYGQGRVSATGQIQLDGFRPARFGYLIDLKGIQFPLTERLTPTLSGQLVFQGTPESQSLRGELAVNRAVYDVRIEVQDWLMELRRRAEIQTVNAAAETATALGRRLALNIHFSGKDQIGIRNNLASIPLEVDLFLRGTVASPYLIGRIEAREGTITFRSNKFHVQSATLDFADPARLRPILDLRATTTVQTYHITLQLTGTIERFELDLTSDPSLTETDILALLTVGRTAEQIAQSQTSVSRDEAASIALQALLEEGVHRLPGVDRLVDSFQIDPYYDETVNQTAPRLSVGKQLLSERLTVNYTTTLDASGRQGVRVEYEIGRNLFLIGEQDNRGFGGDVRYRFEFR
jgi:autotransporter translocation and assembly factor TamB